MRVGTCSAADLSAPPPHLMMVRSPTRPLRGYGPRMFLQEHSEKVGSSPPETLQQVHQPPNPRGTQPPGSRGFPGQDPCHLLGVDGGGVNIVIILHLT